MTKKITNISDYQHKKMATKKISNTEVSQDIVIKVINEMFRRGYFLPASEQMLDDFLELQVMINNILNNC